MALGSCKPSGRWVDVLVHECEGRHHRSSGVQLPLSRRIPSRTTRAARCPAFFAVCNLFLSVSNLSCRLCYLLSLDNLLDRNLLVMFFVLRNPSLQSTWLLQRSVTDRCSSCCFCVTSLSKLGCFLLFNFDLRSNLDLAFSCFLASSAIYNFHTSPVSCCCYSIDFSTWLLSASQLQSPL